MLIWLIIGIALCLLAIGILLHDPYVRSVNAEASLESMAKTSDCNVLHFIYDLHKDEWFKDNYVKIAQQRMVDLKC